MGPPPMLTCPMCKKSVRLETRECPTCRTDLSILVEYVDHLEEGLTKAEELTRAGELGEAVWAYLAVLEVDPDNAQARRQVGQVAAAVRQFDRIALGRRWLDKLHRRARFRHWADSWGRDGQGQFWIAFVVGITLVLGALAVGFFLGAHSSPRTVPTEPAPVRTDKAVP
jgi:hypothetical protein